MKNKHKFYQLLALAIFCFIASNTVYAGAPAAPASSAGTNADCSSFMANWSSSAGATTYFIDVSTSATFGSFVAGYNNLNAGNVTSYYISGLSASTTYYYRVRAYNSSGTSASSSTQSIATTAACSGNLGSWVQIGGGTGGGIDVGDPASGDYEVSAECTDGSSKLFIGGFFTKVNNASSVAAACIACWTPSSTYPYTSGTWTNIGNISAGGAAVSGNNGTEVYAMVYYNGVLYIGGNFTKVNGSTTDGSGNTYNNLAKYTVSTSTWSAVGGSGGVTGGTRIGDACNYGNNTYGGSYPIQALAVDASGDLYVGGNFTTVAGTAGFHNVAMWNGSTWSSLGGGATGSNSNSLTTGYNAATYLGATTPSVYAIDAVDNTHVYAGGQFTTMGGTSTSNIAMWNGSSWSALGAGIPQNAYYNGGCTANSNTDIGYSWSLCPVVLSIANNGTSVYVGGVFSKAGGVSTTNIALWNQSTSAWSSIGGVCYQTNNEAEVTTLYVSNGVLYVGGDFQCQDANCVLSPEGIASYSSWAGMPNNANMGFNSGVSNLLAITSLTTFSSSTVGGFQIIYAGGDFPSSNAGATTNNIAQYAGTSAPSSVLPVRLLGFNAEYDAESGDVNVTWSTASEVNNKEFTIEKTLDGQNWEFVTRVAGVGNSTRRLDYMITDESPYSGISYYRLKQTDYDGNTSYSDIRAITINDSFNKISVVPNPAINKVSIVFNTQTDNNGLINIYDCTGRQVISKEINTIKGVNNISFDVSGINAGIYLVTVSTPQKQYTSKMVIGK